MARAFGLRRNMPLLTELGIICLVVSTNMSALTGLAADVWLSRNDIGLEVFATCKRARVQNCFQLLTL
jgi:hypothetical protein